MAKVKGAIVVDTEQCKGCDLCIPVCAEDVISMSKEVNRKGYHYAYMSNPEAYWMYKLCYRLPRQGNNSL